LTRFVPFTDDPEPLDAMKFASFLTTIYLIVICAMALGADADPAKSEGAHGPSTGLAVLRNPSPGYPQKLMAKGIDGKVLIEATVDAEGKVSKAKVVESSDPAFSEAALAAVRQWVFKPAAKDGQAIPTKVKIPFSFRGMKPAPEKNASED
jgi:protein TonB